MNFMAAVVHVRTVPRGQVNRYRENFVEPRL
jgi:hypothetical protein